ncbi:heme ABC transporter ATP-binding protein [Aureispira anguillae]|uniref:Heme ABC transporter ATP-binding protein n=1 Tax=Aureispira anguillae TaxID=2864201 RepID=A0A915VK00_9BACT|nr:heme ABC transporter ATP-binding protein [Aureispira anguillae]BDS09320.1 heme ABC transporter ATP-binding protein [Aureispira anguillae]
MLNINNITVHLGGETLLEQISFDIQQGDFMVLLGGNGAGKSTLLKTLARSIPYCKGQVLFKEELLGHWNQEELSRNRAVLSQNTFLVFPMNVIEVVLLGRYPYSQGRKPSVKDVAIAYEMLDLMGIAHYADVDITTLSGGEQQRAHIARVLAQVWESSPEHPKLLLLDEPTSNLDIAYQHILLELLQDRVQKHGLVVLTILHDMNLAARYATQIALLKQGKLLAVGKPEETLTPDWIMKAFGVSSIIQEHPIFDCLQVSTY